MTTLDLQSWLSLISTTAIVVALVFAGFQVKEANRTRRDQAAVVMIQSTQDDSFTLAMNAVAQLPAGLSAEQMDASGERAAESLLDFGVRLESIGYMVFLKMVPLATVDDLLGGVVLMFWSRAGGWAGRERERSGNPKLLEWCEWLADRVAERRATLGHEPAHRKHRGWR